MDGADEGKGRAAADVAPTVGGEIMEAGRSRMVGVGTASVETSSVRSRNYSWAELMKRVFAMQVGFASRNASPTDFVGCDLLAGPSGSRWT